MMYTRQSQQGFTLVETLVAITILLLVITGPLTISTSAARSTSFSSEQVVAFFLAQEGAELMQKARDDVLLRKFLPTSNPSYRANPWGIVMSESPSGPYADCFISNGNGCGLELNTDTNGTLRSPVLCTAGNCILYFDDSTDRAKYTHVSPFSGAPPTSFSRVITLSTILGSRDVKVESTVTWRTGSQREMQEVKVETYLYNVYGN